MCNIVISEQLDDQLIHMEYRWLVHGPFADNVTENSVKQDSRQRVYTWRKKIAKIVCSAPYIYWIYAREYA